MQCRSHVARLGRAYQQIQASGAEVVVILGDTAERARSYVASLKLPFPVLSDPERAVYHRYELEMTFIGLQRTASVVVDRAGVIRYIKRVTNPLTWLEDNRELLDFVKTLNSKSG